MCVCVMGLREERAVLCICRSQSERVLREEAGERV